MAQGRSIFYKDRDWNDFHFYHGTVLNQVKIIQPSTYYESRGSISTTYHSDYYDRILPATDRNDGLKFNHDTYTKSEEGVLRGLHYDDKTWKLVSCIHGKIYLAVLDLRGGSINTNPTYGKSETFILSPETGTQVLIPPMFANGHYVMKDDSILSCKMAYKGEFNDVDEQNIIKWDSDKFNIEWPCTNPIISKRDNK
jgi:dTDP-4-dehydrorhamnose 3,5-epimerase